MPSRQSTSAQLPCIRSVPIDGAVMQDDHDAIKPEIRFDLLDEARATYVASFEQDHGPIDPQLTGRFEVLFSGITLGTLTSC